MNVRVLVALLVTAGAIGLTGCGGGGDAAPATTAAPAPVEIRITVAAGRPEGGIRRETVQQGERVALVVTSDVAGLAHVHGYNHDLDLTPGVPARLEFVADVAGRFEIELHGDVEAQIADLSVLP